MEIRRENKIHQTKPRASKQRSAGGLTVVMLLSAALLVSGHICHSLAAENNLSDMDITADVEINLDTDPAVAANLVDVTTRTGIVTLSGRVPNLLSKERSARIAESVKGVRAVVNTLQVVVPLRSDQKIRRDIEDALLADPAADSYEINVMVANGIATLTGTVESRAEKQLAGRMAKAVKGIKELKNEIRVNYTPDRSDVEIKRDIEGQLFWSPYVDSEDITVKVQDGDVTLEGVATYWAEADTAVGNAFEGGALSVRARLDLADGSEYTRYYAHDYDYYWYGHFYESL